MAWGIRRLFNKIARNVERDEEVNKKLEADGWTVIRIWDFQVEQDLGGCVSLVKEAIAST